MQSNTVPDLVSRAQRGNVDAAGQLYERHYQSIFRYLYYRTGDQPTAEDLTADVFIKMVQALPGYRVKAAAFRTWLFQIARNLSIDHFRRWKAHPQVSVDDALPSSGLQPEAAAERSLSAEALRQALTHLSDEQRDVVLMRFIEGMPLVEVAAALHKSEDAIKGLQRRGLMALRELLEEMKEPHGTTG